MKRAEILQAIKEIIAANSPYRAYEIGSNDNLAKFISAGFKDRLAREVKRSFKEVHTTRLTNLLYDSIKTVTKLVDHIDKIYNPN